MAAWKIKEAIKMGNNKENGDFIILMEIWKA